jgi:hypothetical protein
MKLLTGKKWNNGDLAENTVKMKRVHVAHQEKVNASADMVFPLASQAVKRRCIERQGTGLHRSDSGNKEQPALWTETVSGENLFQSPGLKTYWYTTLYDTENHRYHAVLVNPDLAVGKYEIEVEERPDGNAWLKFDFTYTALNPAGNRLFDEGLEGRMMNMLISTADSIARSLKNGLASFDSAAAAPGEAPNSIASERAHTRHEVMVKSDVSDCFALVCPVAELKWIDDWQFDMIYSESGVNENNNIFLEPSSGLAVLHPPGLNTYWYTTLYNAQKQRCHFVLLSRGLVVAKLEIQVNAAPDGNTLIKWDLTYTALSREGNKMIREKNFKDRMFNMLNFLGLCAKHYIETGKIYRVPPKRKLDLVIAITGAKLKRHFQQGRAGISAKNSCA